MQMLFKLLSRLSCLQTFAHKLYNQNVQLKSLKPFLPICQYSLKYQLHNNRNDKGKSIQTRAQKPQQYLNRVCPPDPVCEYNTKPAKGCKYGYKNS